MKKLLFLINPISGSGKGALLATRIAAEMQGRMPADHYDIIYTGVDATEQTQKLAPGYETVVAASGDGTISRIARGLIGVQPRPRLGIIPLGTGNDCARSLGLLTIMRSGGLGALIDLIIAGSTRPVDMLTFGTQHMFINYAGLGRDAEIAACFDRLRKHKIIRTLCARGGSKLLYVFAALACARKVCAPDIQLFCRMLDGTERQLPFPGPLCQLIFSNIDSYGAGVRICSKTCMDDGIFEFAVMRNSSRWLILHMSRLSNRPYDRLVHPDAVIQTREVSLNPATSTFAQIDGETVAIKSHTQHDIRVSCQIQLISAPLMS
jgi:diacylglycerol kinase family enzyme